MKKYRNFSLLCGLIMFLPNLLLAQDTKPDFAHTMLIDPITLYNKVWVKQNFSSYKTSTDSRRDNQTAVEGEFRLGDHFSFVSSVGSTAISRKDMGTVRSWDRLNVGLKSAWTVESSLGLFVFGGGLRVFDKPRDRPELIEESRNLYQVRPNFGMGWKVGRIQLLGDLMFQSETNTAFKERFGEEFRRFGQLNAAFSFGITESSRVFLEGQVRKPWNKTTDAFHDFVMIAPGFSYSTDSMGTLGVSMGIFMGENRQYDNTVRLNYFYFF